MSPNTPRPDRCAVRGAAKISPQPRPNAPRAAQPAPPAIAKWAFPKIRNRRTNDHYIATIAGGWWLAHGPTRDKAVKAVLNAYENSTLTVGEYEPESPIETQLDLFG